MTDSEITVPVLPAGHPRLFVQKKDIPALREKIVRKELSDAYDAYLSRLAEKVDGTLKDPDGLRYSNADSHVLGVIECYAFSYLIDGDEARGRAAIDALLTYHREVVHADYNTEGQELFTLGLVYDWCYPLLTDREKDVFFRAAEQTAKMMEMGYPVFKQGAVTGHGAEGQLMRDLMSAAIAMADERPAFYQRTAEIFFREFPRSKEFFYSFGAYPQGSHYISYRMQWEYLATRLWDSLGVAHVFGDRQREPLYWYLYLMRGDRHFLYDGDAHKTDVGTGDGDHLMYRAYFHGAAYEHDGRLLYEAQRERPDDAFAERGNQVLGVVEYLLGADPDLKPESPAGLPLSRYFGDPRGEMIARTGWDADAAVCQMKVNGIYTANHEHLDGGAFQISYHGYLATDSGYYQAFRNGENRDPASGNTDYSSQHFLSYSQRTVAHNCMLVFDPDEKFAHYDRTDLANDGGQRYPENAKEARVLDDLLNPENGYRVGNVLAHRIAEGENPSYTYLKGDLAPAYSEKVTRYTRSFVFLPHPGKEDEAALVIYDRVESAKASFKKTFLLHTLGEPRLSDGTYYAADPGEGYTGELTLRTLLPKKVKTRVLSGDDAFEVNGVRYLAKVVREDHRNEGGGHRVEISPAASRKKDTFLHVVGIGDTGKEHVSSSYISTASHEGAVVGDNVVLFAKKDTTCAKSFRVSLPAGCKMLFIADLLAGVYRVNGEKKTVGEDGVLSVFDPAPVVHVGKEENES